MPLDTMVRPLLTDPESIWHIGPGVRVGSFRCPVEYPAFATAGRIEGFTIAFPRSAVWIHRADRQPFVADPGIVTVYNRGDRYSRAPLASDGDRSDWFSVSQGLAAAIMVQVDPARATPPEAPFPVAWARVDPADYVEQRLLFRRVRRGAEDPRSIERAVVALMVRVLRRALHGPGPAADGPPLRSHAIVEAARAELARDPGRSPSVRELATRVGVSPFHLCRIFARQTGQTIHDCLLDLRARRALEGLESRVPLSRLAHELGFSSHSHFTASFRRRIGAAPSTMRRVLAGH